MTISAASAEALAELAGRARQERVRASDWAPVLASVPLFAGLSKRHVTRVAAVATPHRVLGGTRIVRAGEPGRAFYVVLDGAAAVRRDGAGDPIRLGPGDWFGELALLDDGPRSATVTAEGEVLLLEVGQRAFLDLLKQEPSIAIGLLRGLAARLRERE